MMRDLIRREVEIVWRDATNAATTGSITTKQHSVDCAVQQIEKHIERWLLTKEGMAALDAAGLNRDTLIERMKRWMEAADER